MTENEYNLKYWLFYIQLEREFCETLNYVEFSDDNFKTYSKAYAKQLISIGSELDIIFKKLCQYVDSSKPRKNIKDYANILCNYDELIDAEVCFSFNRKLYKPFSNWTPDSSPSWWRAYNKIKHHRAEKENIKRANLKNVFYALTALFVLNRYLCKIVCADKIVQEPEIKSNLFAMAGWNICISEGNGFTKVISPEGNMQIVFDNE
ncbi:hypothetical protein [Dorea longicatena]|uniref:Uncharacterized protein n=1 Tax=Dorea longicatena TaxID=88431 RepID=A0A845KIY6_9FIRM|nr:hypothetical protein [Dorea longicatena]MZK16701.1 hypothetical protein [Dorea longicatena]